MCESLKCLKSQVRILYFREYFNAFKFQMQMKCYGIEERCGLRDSPISFQRNRDRA